MLDLNNKHVLVCGGSRGIGAASVKLAAKAGARVSINYRSNKEAADNLVKEIKDGGGEALSIQGDITIEKDTLKIVENSTTQFGKLDGLVISAGIFEGSKLEEMSTDFWALLGFLWIEV